MLFFLFRYYKKDSARKARIAKLNLLINKAFEELNINAYFSFEMMKGWLLDYKELRFLNTIGEQYLEYAEHTDRARECKAVFKDSKNYRSARNQKLDKKGTRSDSKVI